MTYPLRRPASLTAAGVIFVVMGSLGLVIAVTLLIVVAAAVMAQVGALGSRATPSDATGTIVSIVIAIVWLSWTIAHFAAGIGILNRAGWSRTLGVIIASIGALLTLLLIGLIVVLAIVAPQLLNDPALSRGAEARVTEDMVRLGFLVYLVFLAPFAGAYCFAGFALLRRGGWFELAATTFAPHPFPGAPGWPPPAPPGWSGPPPAAQPAPAPSRASPQEHEAEIERPGETRPPAAGDEVR
jgi:hypothetical protein